MKKALHPIIQDDEVWDDSQDTAEEHAQLLKKDDGLDSFFSVFHNLPKRIKSPPPADPLKLFDEMVEWHLLDEPYEKTKNSSLHISTRHFWIVHSRIVSELHAYFKDRFLEKVDFNPVHPVLEFLDKMLTVKEMHSRHLKKMAESGIPVINAWTQEVLDGVFRRVENRTNNNRFLILHPSPLDIHDQADIPAEAVFNNAIYNTMVETGMIPNGRKLSEASGIVVPKQEGNLMQFLHVIFHMPSYIEKAIIAQSSLIQVSKAAMKRKKRNQQEQLPPKNTMRSLLEEKVPISKWRVKKGNSAGVDAIARLRLHLIDALKLNK